jgi:serine/threonine protein kinase
LGVLAYELCCGSPPFECNDSRETKQRIKKSNYSFPDYFSDSLRDFVSRCLQTNASQRMTLKQMLEHPWTQNRALLDD